MHLTHSFIVSLLLVGLSLLSSSRGAEPQESSEPVQSESVQVAEFPPIAPAQSIQSGVLLQPPLDLSWFTQEKFVEEISTVGANKIRKPWTSPVVPLPAHSRPDVKGLTEAEVKEYMLKANSLFHEGKAIPVSDVGLISSQEAVMRLPVLNHICAFENSVARVYLLVQRTTKHAPWSYFSIVQDMTLDPPLDYYGQIIKAKVKLEGTSCYKCHASGPLAIHPAREDLVLDAKLAAALSQRIAEQPESRFYFPKHSPQPKQGKPMDLSFCTSCHEEGSERGPLYQVHSHPIRVMVDFGYMPPDERLLPEEIEELKAWLNSKEEP